MSSIEIKFTTIRGQITQVADAIRQTMEEKKILFGEQFIRRAHDDIDEDD